MELLDGRKLATKIKEEIKQEVGDITRRGDKIPHLATIIVGDEGASQTYVGHKMKACDEVGFKSTLVQLDKTITEEELLEQIDILNNDLSIDGFIVQLPLPKGIDSDKVLQAIDPDKDVDGFHPVNIGRLTLGLDTYVSATPAGIMEMLKRYNIETEGKHCVVIGRSNIVGRPMSILMSQAAYPGNCTVTLCHSRTANLANYTQQADILIVALGRPEFVTSNMVKEGAVVIDVGITRVPDETAKRGYRLKGDVKFEEVSPKCSYITPVPGGVGAMTVVSLMLNTLKAARGKKQLVPRG